MNKNLKLIPFSLTIGFNVDRAILDLITVAGATTLTPVLGTRLRRGQQCYSCVINALRAWANNCIIMFNSYNIGLCNCFTHEMVHQ